MAKRPKVGYSPATHWESMDWANLGAKDATLGRAPNGSVPAAYQAQYTEAYNWGKWFQIQLKRNLI